MCGTPCSAKTSETINVASKTSPIQSVRRPCILLTSAVVEPVDAKPAMAVNMSRAFSQKIERQPVM